MILILHNIRSAYNVGAIFRTADAVGVGEIILAGYTPAPQDQFGRINSSVAKAALGAEKQIPWRKVGTWSALFKKLKKDGYQIIALEQDARAKNYKKVIVSDKAAIIVGDEVRGLSPAVLKRCDIIAEIPMRGKKESLNVSVAVGVALYQFLET